MASEHEQNIYKKRMFVSIRKKRGEKKFSIAGQVRFAHKAVQITILELSSKRRDNIPNKF